MGREIIFLHIGQTGVQLGSAVWELFCLEHGIYANGCEAYPNPDRGDEIFFRTSSSKIVPRAVFCDLEPSPIDEIRTGNYRQLFNPQYMISGKEDAASNFARGYYTVGAEMSEICMDCIRRAAEMCNSLQSFALFRCYGGGTGSGFGANILTKLKRDYKGISILEFVIYPSPKLSPIVVEPYNTVLTTHSTINNTDSSFLFDNEAIYDICERNLNVSDPTFTNINRLIAQVVSGVTASARFEGPLSVNMQEILTNLIPYPRIHYPLVTYAPIVEISQVKHESLTTTSLVNDCFNPMNQMLKCDPRNGKFMSCCLLFRGDINLNEVNSSLERIKMTFPNFTEFTPKPFKVGVNYQPPTFVPGGDLAHTPRAVVMLSNTSAVAPVWARVNSKFEIMFDKRAFVHHYVGEGMEEGEFTEAQEDLKSLENDHRTVGASDKKKISGSKGSASSRRSEVSGTSSRSGSSQ